MMYQNPVEIIETNDYKSEVFKRLKNNNIKNPLIVTSPSIIKIHKVDNVFRNFSQFIVYHQNPNFNSCQEAIDFCGKVNYDGVIAIGGGSVLDTAKVIMGFLGSGILDIRNLLQNSESLKIMVPAIFVPTTHGSGSEVTMWSTIWNFEQKKKYSLLNQYLYPELSILDGSLMVSLPLEISLTTTLDALSHSFEAIWNKNSNPVSTNFAIEAICLILNNVEILKHEPKNIVVRNNLIKASNLAGLAFSNTKTAAAHSISYPLTINYGIPHGIASSMPLIPLLEINKSKISNELTILMKRLDITSISELKNKIMNISKRNLRYCLKDWNIEKKDLNEIVNQSFTKGRMDNNIVDLSFEDVSNILTTIY